MESKRRQDSLEWEGQNFRVLNPLPPPHIASNAAKWLPARSRPRERQFSLSLPLCVCACVRVLFPRVGRTEKREEMGEKGTERERGVGTEVCVIEISKIDRWWRLRCDRCSILQHTLKGFHWSKDFSLFSLFVSSSSLPTVLGNNERWKGLCVAEREMDLRKLKKIEPSLKIFSHQFVCFNIYSRNDNATLSVGN